MPDGLTELLRADSMVIAPGVYDCLTAKLAEDAGFQAVYMTGSGTSYAHYGLPDIGLLTMSEMVANAAAIAGAIDIPVIADADNGYGNALNVRRAVQLYENAGVAAIHIEDQSIPKKCGHFDEKTLIEPEEMTQKIVAAIDARHSDDFLIIARTDALSVEGFEAAMDRGRYYEAAGADIIFVESPTSVGQIQAIPQSFSVPSLFNMAEGKTPFLSSAEVSEFGFGLMIIPSTHRVVIPAVREYFAHLYETGDFGAYSDHLLPWQGWKELVGLEEFRELEAKYSNAVRL